MTTGSDDALITTDVTRKAAQAVKWSVLMELASRAASPIITVILARLLAPADFGVVATAMVAISLAQIFWDAGLSKALIQSKEDPEETAHVVFWTNLFLGLATYAVLSAAAPWVAVFFKSPGSGPVLRVLGLVIVIASLASVQQALFVRDLDFRRLFWVRLFTAFVPGFFSIPLALFGYGVWALVAGTLVGQTLNLVLLWHYSAWRPKLRYETSIARRLLGFGAWVLAESLGGWFIMWGDNLMVGRFLGMHDLGMYRTGCMLVMIIFGLVLNPFLPVLYPAFSRLHHDFPALKENFYKVNRVVMALALPMGTGLLLLGPEVATVLFGSRWQGLGLVLSVIGLAYGMAWLVGINPELYRAAGRPDVNTKLIFLALLYYLPAYYIAARSGLATFLYMRLILNLVAIPLHIYLCRKMLNVSRLYLWQNGKNFFLSSLVMGVAIIPAKWGMAAAAPGLSPVAVLAGLFLTGVAVYAATLLLLDRSFFVQTTQWIRRVALA